MQQRRQPNQSKAAKLSAPVKAKLNDFRMQHLHGTAVGIAREGAPRAIFQAASGYVAKSEA